MEEKKKSSLVLDPNAFLSACQQLFRITKNPVHAIEAFIKADEEGMPPPQWVLSWLLEILKKYYEADGKKDLDELLGFKGGKGPCGTAFEKDFLDRRNCLLLIEIARLHGICGISVHDACCMVEARLRDSPEPTVSERRLKDLHAKGKIFQDVEAWYRGQVHYWTDQQKIDYLLRYPENSISSKVKNRFRLKSHRMK